MKKLILVATAFLVASQAGAYAQDDHASRRHRHLMSSHAQYRGHGGGFYYPAPEYYAPPTYGPSYGPSYDDDAEGRTSG
jgi:hypothetical protein